MYTATCLQPINVSKCSISAQKEVSKMLQLFLIVVGYQKRKLKKLQGSSLCYAQSQLKNNEFTAHGMSSLCLRTRLQKSISSNISFCKIKVIFKSSTRLANFLGSKIRYLCVYAQTLFISLRVVDAMLPITVKLAFILKLELVNTQLSHL